jgi:hypothetical protein
MVGDATQIEIVTTDHRTLTNGLWRIALIGEVSTSKHGAQENAG